MTRKPQPRATWKFNFFRSTVKFLSYFSLTFEADMLIIKANATVFKVCTELSRIFPASNEANFRVRKLQNKGSLTLNLPREYRTDLNLNNQEFRADNRVFLSACRTLLS